ncbi:hypothetical protein H0H93_000251 [Arthromyces matolae]|nr:hypothetical protein H0H93_000251 [Arthromyces matolae]
MSGLSVSLVRLAGLCSKKPSLSHILFSDIEQFWRHGLRIIPEIQLVNGREGSPTRLPLYIHEFLRDTLSLSDQATVDLWDILGGHLWDAAGPFRAGIYQELCAMAPLSQEESALFEKMGLRPERNDEAITHTMFYPPYLTCQRCNKSLKRHERYKVVYHSLKHGSLTGLSSSLRCSSKQQGLLIPHVLSSQRQADCKICYHHNYYVVDGVRIYYKPGVPTAIQFEDHAYIGQDVCELFTALMLYAWVSASNCAHIYNHSFASIGRSFGLKLRNEQVWTAFYMNALLRDGMEHGIFLTLSDTGSNDDRLKEAMEMRNLQMIREGQPQRMHSCDVCEKFIPGTGYKGLRPLRAVVVDGVLVPFPCCKVHNCSIPLASQRDHFCPTHKSQGALCVVANCIKPSDQGFQTCSTKGHRDLETLRKQRNKAFFQLKERLSYATAGQVADSMNAGLRGEDSITFDDLDGTRYSEHKSDSGNVKVNARFTRRRTHNEQLVVCCCGIIAGRATMYGAEAISAVKDFLKSIYGYNSQNLPDCIFFDNNCLLQEHLQASNDSFFRQCILAVDVFHFENKHDKDHKFCQENCNPASWPELYNESSKEWIFNSSAAEQTNAWIGGYLSITRDMLAHRFNFFLDEMIKRRNEVIVGRLLEQGKAPIKIPFKPLALAE